MDRHCRQVGQGAGCLFRTAGTAHRISAAAHPHPAWSSCAPRTFPLQELVPIAHIRVVLFRVPALKVFRATHRPLERRQTEDCRLPLRPLRTAILCRHGTDRPKGTEHNQQYTHHHERGLKLPTGITLRFSSFTFRLLKSNSNSKEFRKLSFTTMIKFCALLHSEL